MQTEGKQTVPSSEAVGRNFGERAKAARIEAGMTQVQLQERLGAEFGLNLDTSGITRIEAGQREPRLSEALAIAAILDFGINNLTPTAPDLDFYISRLRELMHESRETLLTLLRSVDQVTDFVHQNPGCAGDDGIERIFQNEFEWFRHEVWQEPVALEGKQALKFVLATDKSDEKLKRQLLQVITADLIVTAKGLTATNEQRARRPRERTESRLIAEQWEQNFNQLLSYVEDHGHARVPQFYTVDGLRLGMWVVAQRNRHTKGTLEHNRVRQLEALPGWTWGRPRTDHWEEGFRRLADYVKRNGDARVSQGDIVDGFKLGAWASRQRHDKDSLDADRARRLEALPGWTWSASGDRPQRGRHQ
jgi:transcriptional regulator with XRE-family HTH domain